MGAGLPESRRCHPKGRNEVEEPHRGLTEGAGAEATRVRQGDSRVIGDTVCAVP